MYLPDFNKKLHKHLLLASVMLCVLFSLCVIACVKSQQNVVSEMVTVAGTSAFCTLAGVCLFLLQLLVTTMQGTLTKLCWLQLKTHSKMDAVPPMHVSSVSIILYIHFINMVYKYILGQQGGTVVSTVASKQESPGFLEFAYYPRVSAWFLCGGSSFLPQSKELLLVGLG